LVSAQAAPNLLPTLDADLKPQRVFLVVTDAMVRQSQHLEGVFKESGIICERIPIANEHDFNAMSESLLEAGSRMGSDSPVALNITGGTKLMALAAQSVAQTAGWEIFYVDVDSDEVVWIPYGQQAKRKNHKLSEKLRLRYYLRSYGFDMSDKVSPASTVRHNEFLRHLLTNYASYERGVGELNRIGQMSEKTNTLTIVMNESEHQSASLKSLCELMQREKFLSINGATVKFASEQDREFAKGGWLELHTFNVVTSLVKSLRINDSACNLEVTSKDTQAKNEMDIVFLARNRLWVIECKTGRLNVDNAEKANQALFKLAENCRRVGGLGARGLLVTYRSLRPPELDLAKALNITVAQGKSLNTLKDQVSNWVTKNYS
jgi:hypothetical protein